MNQRKVAVIGCGFVGAATAFTLMQSKLFSELVLLDANFDKADGEAKDIAHGMPFGRPDENLRRRVQRYRGCRHRDRDGGRKSEAGGDKAGSCA